MRSLFLLMLLLVTPAAANADELTWEERMSKFEANGRKIGAKYSFVFATWLQEYDAEDKLLFVDMIGRIAAKEEGRLLRFDLRRRQENTDTITTYESGIRTGDKVLKAFDIRPKGSVRAVREGTPPNRQFEEHFIGLNPAFFPAQQFIAISVGHPFDKDRFVAIELIENGTDDKGRDWFAYAPPASAGAIVNKVVFDDKLEFLVVEFSIYVHPHVATHGLVGLSDKMLEEMDPSKYKSWLHDVTTVTSWVSHEKLFVPESIRMRRFPFGVRTKHDVLMSFTDWNFDKEDTEKMIRVDDFEQSKLPDADYFNTLEKKFDEDSLTAD
jgi:hypothetical protein